MTPYRIKMIRVMLWVNRNHPEWRHYSISRDGLIIGRRKGTARSVLGTIEQAFAEFSEKDATDFVKGA